MHSFLEYLKSPELVVKVQEFFGIVYERNKHRKEPSISNGTPGSSAPRNGTTKKGSLPNGNSPSVTHDKKIDDNDNAYRVTNYFWYVLFIVGTELGDEIFYATFIPFWFWNIDSAVGRRVVMVWSAIMYVGTALRAPATPGWISDDDLLCCS